VRDESDKPSRILR